jgi:hypothetical protein
VGTTLDKLSGGGQPDAPGRTGDENIWRSHVSKLSQLYGFSTDLRESVPFRGFLPLRQKSFLSAIEVGTVTAK